MSRRDAESDRRRAERHGRAAEHVVALMLRCKGYRILEQRARTPSGEIDIVAQRGKELVFAEVKARATHDLAVQAVTPLQARRILEAAKIWLARNKQTQDHICRFDIITVSPYLWPQHMANAFGENLW